jgi:2-keto-3-deoxy-L-rhamnonate aldolase RhmA
LKNSTKDLIFMNRNALKDRLAAGKTVVGTYIQEFFTAGIAPIASAAGADFLIYDHEHSGHTSESLRTQLLMSRAVGLTPIVNVPGETYERGGLFLDMGAQGLMVPHVKTRQQCEALVAATRYPPSGNRGGSFGIAHDGFRDANMREIMADADDSVLIIAKLESSEAIENAEAIMSVPGIDVALVTGTDLMLDLGLAGEPNHPKIVAAMDKVLKICRRLGKTAGCPAFDLSTAQRRVAEGYRFVQFSWDIGLFQNSLKAATTSLRAE